MNDNNINPFGISNGEEVSVVTLGDESISCDVLSFGATLQSLTVKNREGKDLDIVLGYDSLEEYAAQDGYLGATVGRFANRIAKGCFSLNGKEYSLAINNGPNHLHGGLRGFSHRVWNVEKLSDKSVTFSITSHDGDENYPGNLTVNVTYTLADNALSIRYEAISDADTLCNLTNHSYFNLAGHDSGSVLKHEIKINAQFFTPTDADSIPTGELLTVEGTPMDFRSYTKIGEGIDSDYVHLVQGKGYDHNYVLDGLMNELRTAAWARSNESGIMMQVDTTLPGVQFYTANYIDAGRRGKGGALYGPRHGFCLETQFFPDSPNHPTFPSAVLKAGERYEHCTIYRFSKM